MSRGGEIQKFQTELQFYVDSLPLRMKCRMWTLLLGEAIYNFLQRVQANTEKGREEQVYSRVWSDEGPHQLSLSHHDQQASLTKRWKWCFMSWPSSPLAYNPNIILRNHQINSNWGTLLNVWQDSSKLSRPSNREDHKP